MILCRRGSAEAGAAPPARDHGQAEADSERGQDTDLQGSGRGVRLLGLYVRTNVLSGRRARPGWAIRPSKKSIKRMVEKVHALTVRARYLAGDHRAGGIMLNRALRGWANYFQCWNHPSLSVSGARQLRGYAVAPVVALQAQGQATQGRELSTPAPLRALRARTPDPAWSRPVVGEGVTSCPRAGCGKSACPVR